MWVCGGHNQHLQDHDRHVNMCEQAVVYGDQRQVYHARFFNPLLGDRVETTTPSNIYLVQCTNNAAVRRCASSFCHTKHAAHTSIRMHTTMVQRNGEPFFWLRIHMVLSLSTQQTNTKKKTPHWDPNNYGKLTSPGGAH